MAEEWSRWNDGIVAASTRVIEEFRANGGAVGGYFAGAPMLLLHHVGARAGTERVNPLVYLRDGDDLVVSASEGGDPRNPAWYHDLKAHPRVVVEVGTETVAVEAVEVTGPERDELYAAGGDAAGLRRLRIQDRPGRPDVPADPESRGAIRSRRSRRPRGSTSRARSAR